MMPILTMSSGEAGKLGLGCHANRDGDCSHADCPQLRDGEPEKSGRHCPLDYLDEEE